MNATLESDLKRCADMMSSKWSIQNKDMDNVTKFIYNSETLNDCLSEANTKKLSDEARNYALHRWFNFKTSIYCEELFCDYGDIHDEDQYNHDVDIYINNIPFDVKLTVYPAKLSNKPYDLTIPEALAMLKRIPAKAFIPLTPVSTSASYSSSPVIPSFSLSL